MGSSGWNPEEARLPITDVRPRRDRPLQSRKKLIIGATYHGFEPWLLRVLPVQGKDMGDSHFVITFENWYNRGKENDLVSTGILPVLHNRQAGSLPHHFVCRSDYNSIGFGIKLSRITITVSSTPDQPRSSFKVTEPDSGMSARERASAYHP